MGLVRARATVLNGARPRLKATRAGDSDGLGVQRPAQLLQPPPPRQVGGSVLPRPPGDRGSRHPAQGATWPRSLGVRRPRPLRRPRLSPVRVFRPRASAGPWARAGQAPGPDRPAWDGDREAAPGAQPAGGSHEGRGRSTCSAETPEVSEGRTRVRWRRRGRVGDSVRAGFRSAVSCHRAGCGHKNGLPPSGRCMGRDRDIRRPPFSKITLPLLSPLSPFTCVPHGRVTEHEKWPSMH